MKSSSPRSKLILTILVALVVVIAAAALLIVPQARKIASLERDLAGIDDEMTQATNLLRVRQEAKANASSTDAASLALAAAIPENPDLPSLIIELQDVAYANDVQIRSVEPKELKEEDGYVAVPVGITIWGSWTDTVEFVQQISKLGRQVRIVETVTSLPGDDAVADAAIASLGKYTVQTDIVVETYVIPKDAGKTVAPPAPSSEGSTGGAQGESGGSL